MAQSRCSSTPDTDTSRPLTRSATSSRTFGDAHNGSFELVLGRATTGDPVKAGEVIAPLAEAGATWWDERQVQASDDVHRLTPVLRRITQGPPAL
jgi:hypothetical protein